MNEVRPPANPGSRCRRRRQCSYQASVIWVSCQSGLVRVCNKSRKQTHRRAVELLVVSWWQRRAAFLHTLPAGWRDGHQFTTCADWARPREIEQPERGNRSGWTQVLWPFDDVTPPLLSLAPYRRTESLFCACKLGYPLGSRNQARDKSLNKKNGSNAILFWLRADGPGGAIACFACSTRTGQ